jgi:phage repressor protein C with HTH and peptisase S24 domain
MFDDIMGEENIEIASEIMPNILHNKKENYIKIYTYDLPASAGFGNYIEQSDGELLPYPASDVPRGADVCIVLSGNSMEPVYTDGATVYVKETHKLENGEIGIFIHENEAVCKKLKLDYGEYGSISCVRLVSLNPAYDDRIVEQDDELRTVGRVLGAARIQ